MIKTSNSKREKSHLLLDGFQVILQLFLGLDELLFLFHGGAFLLLVLLAQRLHLLVRVPSRVPGLFQRRLPHDPPKKSASDSVFSFKNNTQLVQDIRWKCDIVS